MSFLDEIKKITNTEEDLDNLTKESIEEKLRKSVNSTLNEIKSDIKDKAATSDFKILSGKRIIEGIKLLDENFSLGYYSDDVLEKVYIKDRNYKFPYSCYANSYDGFCLGVKLIRTKEIKQSKEMLSHKYLTEYVTLSEGGKLMLSLIQEQAKKEGINIDYDIWYDVAWLGRSIVNNYKLDPIKDNSTITYMTEYHKYEFLDHRYWTISYNKYLRIKYSISY